MITFQYIAQFLETAQLPIDTTGLEILAITTATHPVPMILYVEISNNTISMNPT